MKGQKQQVLVKVRFCLFNKNEDLPWDFENKELFNTSQPSINYTSVEYKIDSPQDDVLKDLGHAEFWPCLDMVTKAISSQIARKMAISAQAAIGLRHFTTWRAYMYMIITKYIN